VWHKLINAARGVDQQAAAGSVVMLIGVLGHADASAEPRRFVRPFAAIKPRVRRL